MNLAGYNGWLGEISKRYRQSQIKAAVAVNTEMLKFYFGLGHDIVRMEKDQPWGSGFLKRLSVDLKMQIPDAECFSPTNLAYMRRSFKIYSKIICPQVEGELVGMIGLEIGTAISPQVGEEMDSPIFHVPKKPTHDPTIGLLVCKTKDNTMVKWALESSQQPIGVSEYRISEILPKEIASDLPSIADIESAVGGVG